jgi:hypothetical protein
MIGPAGSHKCNRQMPQSSTAARSFLSGTDAGGVIMIKFPVKLGDAARCVAESSRRRH